MTADSWTDWPPVAVAAYRRLPAADRAQLPTPPSPRPSASGTSAAHPPIVCKITQLYPLASGSYSLESVVRLAINLRLGFLI